ncbi:site-specific DNA-methyltransferase [Staphylococcus agnetis]|uniref:site-specific DNA-methyltransferase n=1 Tax=Staphylococcus agnetis TaxID=985762 RepID=UPI0021D26EE1|nr:site-specific DNA-methyltransferase [Staphylococcus agnetis]UXU55003.1 site-specific DNA-methyltransferase [Staphylococcus agnetis]
MIKDNENFNNTVSENNVFLEELREKIPNYFRSNVYDEEGNLIELGGFDYEKFNNNIKNSQQSSFSSSYTLNFVGKNYAKKQAGEKPTSIIVPNKKVNFLNKSENLIFSGDNLEVLRHLQNNYQNRIEYIYIDPPYNTGSDGFTYPDKFEYSDEKLMEIFNLSNEELIRFKSIQGKSNHSAWLAFMYPRLLLARKLLTETGKISVSIDENEFATLKVLLDEIFGESSFVGDIIRKTKSSTNDSSIGFNQQHEHTLVYAKNINQVKMKGDAKELGNYKNIDDDPNGPWKSVDPSARSGSKKALFEIKNPYTGTIDLPPKGRYWAFSKTTFEQWVESGKVKFKKEVKGSERGFIVKKYLKDIKNKYNPVNSLFGVDNKYMNQVATKYLVNLFDGESLFTSPKPVEFIEKLVRYFSDENSIILDFFGGSGTTAEAVIEANIKEETNRKYIIVQIPEKTYSVTEDNVKVPVSSNERLFELGYKTIDELTLSRIDKIYEKNNERNLDLYRHYYVVDPPVSVLEKIDDFENISLNLFDNMIDLFSSENLGVEGDATGEEVIIENWLVQDNYDFNTNVSKITILDYEANYIKNSSLYLIKEGWRSKNTKELVNLIGKNNLLLQNIVIYGYSFGFEETRELEIALNQLDNKVNLIKRF